MEDRKYRYYLRSKNGSSWDWYTVSAGSVTYSTSLTPTNPLSKIPKGWGENMINFSRKFPNAGILKTYTTPLQFVKDGAKIVRHFALTYGTEAILELYIEKFNPTLAVNDYEFYYSGELNFIGEVSDKDFDTLECFEGGFLAKLAARESSTYELELNNAPDRFWVRLHPNKLRARLRWVGAPTTTVSEDFNGHGVPILSPLETEGTNIYFGTYDQQFTNPIQFLENQDGSSHTVTLTFTYDYYCTNLSGANAWFEIGYQFYDITNSNTISHVTVYQDPTPIGASSSAWRTGTQSTTITIGSNVGIYIEVRMKDGGGANLPNSLKTMVQGNSNAVEFETEVMTDEVYFPVRRVESVYNELVDKISDSETTGESNLLGSTFSDMVLSSGDGLRNLYASKLKIVYRDFVESLDSMFCISNYYDRNTNRFKLESKDSIFDNTQIMDLGEVTNFKRLPFTSEMFNTLKAGYTEQTYDSVNGKDEPNNLSTWLSPIVRVKNDKNAASTIRADRTGAVLVSLNLTGKKYSDSSTDNDLFIFKIGSSVAGTIPVSYGGPYVGENYYDLYIDSGLTISNVYDSANLFNVDLSPKRCLLRNGKYYRSILDNLDSKYLKFQTNNKTNVTDAQMVTTDGVTTIDEGKDILISELGDQYFKAQMFEFETKVDFDLNSVMIANPFGYARFTHKGNEIFAYILDATQDPTYNSKQTFKCLCHPSTNLSNLIY